MSAPAAAEEAPAVPEAPEVQGTFAALRNRNFRILWAGSLISTVAFFMSTLVQSVVAFQLLGTNRAVGYVVFAQGITMFLLGPIGGTGADRWPKRRVVAMGQIAAGAVFAALSYLIATGQIHIAFLAGGSLIIGASFAFLGPARQSLAIDLVSTRNRGNAMAVSQLAVSVSQVLGPALAGVLLTLPWVGPAGAYAVMAAFYFLAAALLVFLPRSVVRPGALDRHVLTELADGLRYVAGHRRLRLLVLLFVSVIMLGFPYVTVFPGLVENQLGRAAKDVSGLLFASALGGVGATLLAARYADTIWGPRLYVGMGLLFGTMLFAFFFVPTYTVALAVAFGMGVGSGGCQAMNAALIVREADPAFLGRVLSLTLLAFAGFGLMGLPIGVLADQVGERATLALMGAAVAGVVIVLTTLLARTPAAE